MHRAAGEPVKKPLYTPIVAAVIIFGLTFTYLQYYLGTPWKRPLSILLFVTWALSALVGYFLSPLSSSQGRGAFSSAP